MPPPNTAQIRILLVDDDKFLLDMYALKFKKESYAVDTCASSTEALAKLRNGEKFDIILLDIIMPTMDGLELLKIIRDERLVPESVILMLTNQSDESERAKALGVDGYIIKATSIPSEVVSRVAQAYKQKKQSNP